MKKSNYKIVVASGKGGVGKSMLTSGLAYLFSKDEKITAVDCDVDTPNLHIWLNETEGWEETTPVQTSKEPKIDYEKCDGCGKCVENCNFNALSMSDKKKPVVNNFLCEGCGACQVTCPQNAIKLEPISNGELKKKKTKYGFPLISGNLFPGETGSGKIVTELKKEADKEEADYQIIDSPPGTGCPVIAALRDADLCILITEPTLSGFSDIKRIFELVKYFDLDYKVVCNKWDINKEIFKKIKNWKKDNFIGKISYNKEIFKSISKLEPIMESELEGIKDEIIEIYDKIRKEIK